MLSCVSLIGNVVVYKVWLCAYVGCLLDDGNEVLKANQALLSGLVQQGRVDN